VFGGGSAFTGFVMPLPVPCANTNRNVGEAGIYDASTNIIHPVQLDVWTDVAYGLLSNGTSVFPLTSLSPITWAASDEIWWNVRYPAA
jgi:hypothetical protein